MVIGAAPPPAPQRPSIAAGYPPDRLSRVGVVGEACCAADTVA
jgi:hypothetical protein